MKIYEISLELPSYFKNIFLFNIVLQSENLKILNFSKAQKEKKISYKYKQATNTYLSIWLKKQMPEYIKETKNNIENK